MGRRRQPNLSLTVALCTSLSVHALGLSALAWWYVLHAEPTRVARATPAEIARLMLPPPPPSPPPPRPKPKSKPRPPKPPAEAEPEPPDRPFRDDSGEANGRGSANRSTPGDRPMRALRGPEQADLMRAKVDPNLIDPTARRAAQSGKPVPDDALPIAPADPQHGVVQPDFMAAANAAVEDPAGEVVRKTAPAHAPGPLPASTDLVPPAEPVLPPAPSGVRSAVANRSVAVVPPPPARQAHGRLATASNTESVPFAKDATVEFHAGQTQGRQGKDVRMYNPRWGLASEDDLYALGSLHAVFGAHVRPDGSVSLVEVIHSSGSPNVDLDCERAVYAGRFEPRKDKDGHPVETLWTVVYD